MEKLFAPADKVLTEIGRLVLIRPLFSGVLLISAIAITLFSNTIWDSSSSSDTDTSIEQQAEVAVPLPALTLTTPVAAAAIDDSGAQTSSPSLNTDQPVAASTNDVQATPTTSTPATLQPTALAVPDDRGQTVIIRSGDTLSSLFKGNGFSAKEVVLLSRLTGAKALRHLKLGQEMRLYKNAEGQLQQLVYAVSDKNTLNIVRSGSTYKASLQAAPLAAIAMTPTVTSNTVKVTSPAVITQPSVTPTTVAAVKPAVAETHNSSGLRYASGRINRSLTTDARKAGLSAKQINQLVQIFSNKNVARSMRPGDEFSVLYENPAKSGSKKITGNILAAQLTTKGKTYQLIRFTDPKGRTEYYNPQGQSLRDGIMRTPLQFTHVSSPFSKNRLDPVLGFRRPHDGVDFAASFGAPIQAAGDGVLTEIGYKGGYGKAVMIKHDSKYTTLYAHLSRFASNVREGQNVRKGQIIGYVGQTGFATGPHLHYEIRVNNAAANPLTIALPGATIPQAYRRQFLAQSKMLLAQLNTNKHQVQLAQRADAKKQS